MSDSSVTNSTVNYSQSQQLVILWICLGVGSFLSILVFFRCRAVNQRRLHDIYFPPPPAQAASSRRLPCPPPQPSPSDTLPPSPSPYLYTIRIIVAIIIILLLVLSIAETSVYR